MKRSETAVLLAKMSAFDQRTIGESDVEAWTDGLEESGISLTDALAVVTNHFRTSRDRIMPFHIIEGCRVIRRERLARYGPPPIPPELNQAQEREWAKLWRAAIRDGHSDPESAANHAMDIRPQLATGAPVPKELRDELIRKLAESKSIPKVREGQPS